MKGDRVGFKSLGKRDARHWEKGKPGLFLQDTLHVCAGPYEKKLLTYDGKDSDGIQF